MNNQHLEEHNALVMSYIALRKALGILGILLPFILLFGAWIIFQTAPQRSISFYYRTGMREVFVGSLWATAIFLLAYKGYGLVDRILGVVGCIGAVGITLFPTLPAVPSDTDKWINAVHLIFGAVFFSSLIIFSFFLFTRTDSNSRATPQRRARHWVYRICGFMMFVCVVISGFILWRNGWQAPDTHTWFQPVFILETIALVAFGVSWLTKGQAILWDPAI